MPGQRDDRHGALAEDLASRLDTVEARQVEVEQDHVRPMLAGEIDGFDSVAGVRDVESGVFEDQPQVGPNDRIVFDGEDFRRARAVISETFRWKNKRPQAFCLRSS